MANLSKSAINKKYDELRSQLTSGELSRKDFKIAADRLYTMYHGKANKAQRAKDAKPTTQRQQAPKTQQAPKQTKTSAKTTETAKQRQARILKDKPATGPMKLAAEAKRARILKDKPATGAYKLAAEAKKAKKAIEEYEKKKKAKQGRSTMPYAGKFPGEPNKNDKRSQFPRFFK